MGVNTEYLVLTAFGGYLVTSLLLLKFPRLLHKKKNLLVKARHISHRGGAGENLENTMEAFRHAVRCGTDMLELDCHVTKDGHVVVSHDNEISRSTGQHVKISDTMLKDLPLLLPVLKVTFSGGDVCRTASATEDSRRFALLREVFSELPEIPINIDIKNNDDNLIAKVNELIVEFEREKNTVWGSMNNLVSTKLYQLNPSVSQFCSIRRVALLILQFYTGILPFVSVREDYLEIPMSNNMLTVRSANISWKWKFVVKAIDFLLMNRWFLKHMQGRGCQVYLWVLNNDEAFERALLLGADGIMTDYPTRLSQFLQNHPMQKERISTASHERNFDRHNSCVDKDGGGSGENVKLNNSH